MAETKNIEVSKIKALKIFGAVVLLSLIIINLASALVVLDSLSQEKLYPGKGAEIVLKLKNNFDDDVEDVSVVLNLENTGFITQGGAESSEDKIRDDDSETFGFDIKASSSLSPGDYNIPYTITYTFDDNKTTKTGSFGITVSVETELGYVIETENNVVGQQGKVSLKIINKGLGDINFVSIKFASVNGFEILSSKEEYIGTVRSDDFETASVDVLFKSTFGQVTADIVYKDFENKEQTETITLPVKVYSREKALEIGLIKKNNTIWDILLVVFVVLIWIIYRKIKKARRKRRLDMGVER